MAFYKKEKQKSTGMWYPRVVSVGSPADTGEVAERLAKISTVTRADVLAVLGNLPDVLSEIMAQGRTVRLDGLGTFYYTADTGGRGVPTPDEVSPEQIRGVRVRFIPEYSRTPGGKIASRSLVSGNIEWIEYGTAAQEE